jgi:peptide-methionine (S)-S-oxide reductase
MPRWGLIAAAACLAFAALVMTVRQPPPSGAKPLASKAKATATFASGCFWCTEAVFQKLKGVESVVAGYTGGTVPNPTYEQVCSETTGHAEAIEITYDPAVVSYDTLLEVFWKTHDPTTLNRQGNDHGTSYRSAIFYHDEEQRRLAESYKEKLTEAGVFKPGNIVTEIVPAKTFYVAEDKHQDFYNQHPMDPYCRSHIPEKLEKLREVFADKLR